MHLPDDSYTPLPEILKLVQQYESSINQSLSSRFSVDDIVSILAHYELKEEYEEAKNLSVKALEEFPYHIKIIEAYLSVLSSDAEFELLIEYVERIELLVQVSDLIVYHKASALQAMGETKEAIKELKEYLEKAESKSNILFQIGELYKQEAQYLEAQNYYCEALIADSNNYDPLHELLVFHSDISTIDTLLIFMEELTSVFPLSKNAWFGLGYCQHKLGLFEPAIESYDNSIAIDPTDEKSWLGKGHSLMNLQKFEEAYQAYLEVFEIEGDSPSLFVHLGASQEHQKNYSTAIEFYKKAIRIDQNYEDAWYGIGMCFLSQERYMESMHYIKKAIDLNAEHELFWLALAQAEWKSGNIVSALEAFEQSCELDPENADVWLDWSFIYYDQGDYDKAIHLIMDGIEELPMEAELWYRAVVYAMGCGRYKDALNYLENALLLDFEKHVVLFDFFNEIETQKTLYKLIEQFRIRNQSNQ